MATKTIEIEQVPTSLSELVSLALSGTEVILAKNNQPLVRLVPIGAMNKSRVAGLNAGSMQTSEDFDAPLPETFWTGTP